MSSYQKFTLKTIQTNLKNGKYKDATGANRAVGKTQELSEADKAKAKAMIAKHFGVEAKVKPAKKAVAKPSKAAPKAGKAAGKKTEKSPKKTPKKDPVKPAKKAAPKQVAKETAPAAAPTRARKATAGAGRGKRPTAAKAAAPKKAAKSKKDPESAPVELDHTAVVPAALKHVKQLAARGSMDNELIANIGKIIETINMALKAMDVAKHLYPKGSFDAGVSAAQSAMTKAVQALDTNLLSHLNKGGSPAASSPKKSSVATVTSIAKTTPKQVKKVKEPVTVEPSSDELDDLEDPVEESVEEAPIDQDLLDRDDLDDATRRNIMLGRKHKPAVDRFMASRGNGVPED